MPEAVIPLQVGQKASSDDVTGAARLVVNWMVDSNGAVRPRPGISSATFDPSSYSNPASGVGIIGCYVWKNVINQREYLVYVRSDRMIFAKDLVSLSLTALSSSSDVTTKLDGAATVATFAEDSQRLVIAGGGQLQVWTGSGLSSRIASTVVGVNQPPMSATHVVSLANYLIANQVALPGTNNQIIWSGLGDGNHTTWSPLNFNTADADPDPVVALSTNLREVVAFGTKTVQAFGIGSDPTLPFSATTSLTVGCGAPYSVIKFDGQYAWLDETRRFVVSDVRSMQHISQDVDKLIRDLSTVSDCFGFRLRIAYWDSLVWVFPTAARAYVYDLSRKEWYQWRGWNGVDDYAAVRIGAYDYWRNGNLHFVGDPTYENIFTLDPAMMADYGPGLPLVNERVTERLDQGTGDRKRTKFVRFFLKRGTTGFGGTPAYLDVAKKDDDGAWSGQATLSLGVQGDYTSFVDWYPGGLYRRRQYRVRYSGSVDLSITRAVEFFETVGG